MSLTVVLRVLRVMLCRLSYLSSSLILTPPLLISYNKAHKLLTKIYLYFVQKKKPLFRGLKLNINNYCGSIDLFHINLRT